MTRPKQVIIGVTFSLLLSALFIFFTLQWEDASTRLAFWGDSFPNTDHVYSSLRAIHSQEDGIGPWHESLYTYGTRPPAFFMGAALFLAQMGTSHVNLILFQSLLLALGGLALFAALFLEKQSLAAALGAQGIFLFAPETINQAHNFLQAAPAATCIALSLLGVVLCRQDRALGALILGFSLGVGLLVRKQMVFMAAIPIAIYALPALYHQIRQRPIFFVIPLLMPLIGASLWPIALHFSWVEEGFHPLMFVIMAILSLPLLAIPPVKGKNTFIFIGLCIAAALAIPWYLANTRQTLEHLQMSGAIEVGGTYSASTLIRFQYLSLFARNLTWPLLPLFIAGVALCLWKRGPALIVLFALIIAHFTYPLYFHARYAYPLSVYIAYLAGAAIAPLGVRGFALTLPILALGFLRLAGWALPLHLPTQAMAFTGNEAQEWYQGDWHEALKIGDDSVFSPAGIFYTFPPNQGVDWVAEILKTVDAHCENANPCPLYYHQPPLDFHAFSQMDSVYAYRYRRYFFMQESRIKPVENPYDYAHSLTYLIFKDDAQLNTWLQVHGDMGWQMIQHDKSVLNMQGLLLKSMLKAPQRQGHHQPYQWDAP